jgi:hypothetical protein
MIRSRNQFIAFCKEVTKEIERDLNRIDSLNKTLRCETFSLEEAAETDTDQLLEEVRLYKEALEKLCYDEIITTNVGTNFVKDENGDQVEMRAWIKSILEKSNLPKIARCTCDEKALDPDVIIDPTRHSYQVFCGNCGKVGKPSSSYREAVEDWNSNVNKPKGE